MMYNINGNNNNNDDNNNKCQKFPEKTFLRDFNKQFLKLMKKAVLHTTTLMHCKARQVLRDLFSANQGYGSEMTFVAGATKVNLKNLKI